MSVDVAYPVLRTTDPARALRVARQLLALGDLADAVVDVGVELVTVEGVLRVRNALPDTWFEQRHPGQAGGRGGLLGLHESVRASELPTGPAALAPHLPLWASALDQPLGSIEDAFTAVVGDNVGEIRWWGLSWPEVAEHGIYRDLHNAEVRLLFNTPTRELDERADEHTVLVHVRRQGLDGYEEHANWLARQVGQSVVGPPQPA
ncbi:hypothetical protein QFZ82_002784 [Streptomyces sp. V4I23]|uniref:hypothetical protein n=1 Tax=Streptomyces sp. V4I23 TaxID=3042282 RepID=UPI002789B5B2|nr:hypothetical protein [Streptomyces sp. V4I23]MDQ1008299.1 hypothetical protein [Streptomyces sp. V4I23]